MRYFLPLTLLLALAGCTREGEGVVLLNGRLVAHTPQAEATLVSERLARLAEKITGKPALVTLSPAPVWERYAADRYSWETVTVTIRLPAGTYDHRRLTEVVRDDLNLQVPRAEAVQVVLGEPLAAGTTTAASVGPITTYTIQPGDTLAQITALHYGSTGPWKRIVDANPGLDSAKLVPGATITIPPLQP